MFVVRFQNLLFIVICLQTATSSVNKTDRYACYDDTTRTYVCCAYFEEINGECKACKTGFQSRKGLSCVSCPTNHYGNRCLKTCMCSSFQLCDNVHGCVTKQKEIVTEPAYITTGTSRKSLSPDGSVVTLDLSEGITTGRTSAVTQHNDEKSNGTTQVFSEDTNVFSKTNLLIYSGVATTIIMVLFICHLYNKYKRNRKHDLAEIRTNEVAHTEHDSDGNDVMEMSEGLYHVIDESKMTNSDSDINPYLDVINGSSSSNSHISIEGAVSASSQQPYNSLVLTEDDIADSQHPYKSLTEQFDVHKKLKTNYYESPDQIEKRIIDQYKKGEIEVDVHESFDRVIDVKMYGDKIKPEILNIMTENNRERHGGDTSSDYLVPETENNRERHGDDTSSDYLVPETENNRERHDDDNSSDYVVPETANKSLSTDRLNADTNS